MTNPTTTEVAQRAAEEIQHAIENDPRMGDDTEALARIISKHCDARASAAEKSQCPVTCAAFPMNGCKEPHQCVSDEGHPFDPMCGEIHRFVTHMMPVEPRAASTHARASQWQDIDVDRQFIAGAEFGWNCGVSGDKSKFDLALKSRRGQISEETDNPSANVC